MKNLAVMALFAGVLVGCATPKTWVATGGSRADGVVSLAYEYGVFEAPEVNEQQAVTEAAARCAVWGYTHAVAFGGEVRSCSSPDGFGGCNLWRVTKDYQCTGDGG